MAEAVDLQDGSQKKTTKFGNKRVAGGLKVHLCTAMDSELSPKDKGGEGISDKKN